MLLNKLHFSTLTQIATLLRNLWSHYGQTSTNIGINTISLSIIGKVSKSNPNRVKFMELIKTLTPKQASSILAREIQDFDLKRAVVQKVVLGIKAREECIR
jgi:hypothetical protein